MRCRPDPVLRRAPGRELQLPAAPRSGSFAVTGDTRIGVRRFAFGSARFRNIGRIGLRRRALRVGPFLETVCPAVGEGNTHFSALILGAPNWVRRRYIWETGLSDPRQAGRWTGYAGAWAGDVLGHVLGSIVISKNIVPVPVEPAASPAASNMRARGSGPVFCR